MTAPEIDALIVDVATGARRATEAELQRIVEHVAQAGFDPHARERVRGRLAGAVWRGQVLRGRDQLPPAELKYLWHVVSRREWPPGTSMEDYLASIRQVILDPASGVLTSRYEGLWQLGVVRRSGDLRGPRGFEWILVEYRVATGHWVTAFQPEQGLGELRSPRRDELRWLRQPRRTNR